VLDNNWNGQDPTLYAERYLFQGGRYDTTTGLYNYRNRDQSPALGRWLQNDPLGFDAGDSNLYRYVKNQPTVGTDPSGLDGIPNWIQAREDARKMREPKVTFAQNNEWWIENGAGPNYGDPHPWTRFDYQHGFGSFKEKAKHAMSILLLKGSPRCTNGICNTLLFPTLPLGDNLSGGALGCYMDNFEPGTYQVKLFLYMAAKDEFNHKGVATFMFRDQKGNVLWEEKTTPTVRAIPPSSKVVDVQVLVKKGEKALVAWWEPGVARSGRRDDPVLGTLEACGAISIFEIKKVP
jgi:RHS repeat-associated protein